MERTGAYWLQDVLGQAASEGWCMQLNCTTCGCPEMRALLTGYTWSRGQRPLGLGTLSWERALQVVDGLRLCDQNIDAQPVMWLLYAIWLRFGEKAHEELFPRLDESFAGTILDRMKAHHANDVERRRIHNLKFGLKKKDWPE
jgi:hypothetical protein